MVRPLDLPAALLEEVAGAVPLLVERTRSQVELAQRVVSHLPCLGRHGQSAGPEDGADGGTAAHTADGASSDAPLAPVVPISAAAVEPDVDAPAPHELSIPEYDSLAASQVVPRLASLSIEELADVEAYERAHRARQTILNRVRQLQSAADGS